MAAGRAQSTVLRFLLVIEPVEERGALQVLCRKRPSNVRTIRILSGRIHSGGRLVSGLAASVAALAVAGAFGCAGVHGRPDAGDNTAAAGTGGSFVGTGGGGAPGTAGLSAPSFDAGDPFDLGANVRCGNGKVEQTERCDDGNDLNGDGCSSGCTVELDYTCPKEGQPCVHDIICGDHMIEGMETCDDGNKTSGDGCASDCTLECGWECPPGAPCRALKCGDSMMAGQEQCDDGNTTDGDGCSKNCLLESKPIAEPEGWKCTSPKQASGCVGPTTCTTTKCGDKVQEGSEQCDTGDVVTGDGCSPFCRLEPICPAAGGPCATACGDGLLLDIDVANGQECDDGNTVDGDGCSAKCKVEAGFTCKPVSTKPDSLVLPIVYHDFKGWNEGGPNAHPDFQNFQGDGRGRAGIVQPMLGGTAATGGIPVHVAGCAPLTANMCAGAWSQTTDWFGMWYVDNPMFNKTIVATLTLPQIMGGAFQFGTETFFPIDGKGWGNTPGQGNNFGFTSSVRHWFEYTGAGSLTFVGDDDVWVFVNKMLAVDLGGTHIRKTGSITLDAADGTGYACDFIAPGTGNGACDPMMKMGGHVVPLGLKMGSVYEIVVFQAERFTTESHYQLTLSNFTGVKSACMSTCGDGVVTPPEICDLGPDKNTGEYGGCKPDCTPAPYCGDKIVDMAHEECDSTADCLKTCKKRILL
jgi:fibro-slime domain-containing protein